MERCHVRLLQNSRMILCRRVLQGPPTNAETPFSRALKDSPTIVYPSLDAVGLTCLHVPYGSEISGFLQYVLTLAVQNRSGITRDYLKVDVV